MRAKLLPCFILFYLPSVFPVLSFLVRQGVDAVPVVAHAHSRAHVPARFGSHLPSRVPRATLLPRPVCFPHERGRSYPSLSFPLGSLFLFFRPSSPLFSLSLPFFLGSQASLRACAVRVGAISCSEFIFTPYALPIFLRLPSLPPSGLVILFYFPSSLVHCSVLASKDAKASVCAFDADPAGCGYFATLRLGIVPARVRTRL
ncbi:hypothetical protein B0H17DRAFT_1031318 [Mycena rosella]|uniref:Transmembrane protein n=1 Tax=Mycena rosella TaxID=1033263 RepID=A0AAD7MB24_MYCRO|nr:hypothetical protein B0H17DRAFT_1031318 [Mycena rosella]